MLCLACEDERQGLFHGYRRVLLDFFESYCCFLRTVDRCSYDIIIRFGGLDDERAGISRIEEAFAEALGIEKLLELSGYYAVAVQVFAYASSVFGDADTDVVYFESSAVGQRYGLGAHAAAVRAVDCVLDIILCFSPGHGFLVGCAVVSLAGLAAP